MHYKNLNFIVVIPARFKSSRLKGKPLIDLHGIPMIIRTYRQCLKVFPAKLVYIATDNNKIKKVCEKEKAKVIMTSSKCLTGTDRVAEVSKKISAKTYINVKGWRQVCVYAFPRKTLKIFSSVKKKTELEKIEDIEYLRFLELGLEVRAVKMSKNSMAVDTPHDVKLVKKKIAKLGLK